MNRIDSLIDRHRTATSALMLLAVCGVCALGALITSSRDLASVLYIVALIGAPAAILAAFVVVAYGIRRHNSLRVSILRLIALVVGTVLVWFMTAIFFGVLYMDSMFGSFGKTVEVRRQWLLLDRLILLPLAPENIFPQLQSWSQSIFSVPSSMFVFAMLLFGLGLLVFFLSRFRTKGLVASLIIGLLPVAVIAALSLDPSNFSLSNTLGF